MVERHSLNRPRCDKRDMTYMSHVWDMWHTWHVAVGPGAPGWPRMSKHMVGLVGRSAKSVLADGCCADFDFVLMSSSSAEGMKRHAGYVCRVVMHGDMQLGEL